MSPPKALPVFLSHLLLFYINLVRGRAKLEPGNMETKLYPNVNKKLSASWNSERMITLNMQIAQNIQG